MTLPMCGQGKHPVAVVSHAYPVLIKHYLKLLLKALEEKASQKKKQEPK